MIRGAEILTEGFGRFRRHPVHSFPKTAERLGAGTERIGLKDPLRFLIDDTPFAERSRAPDRTAGLGASRLMSALGLSFRRTLPIDAAQPSIPRRAP